MDKEFIQQRAIALWQEGQERQLDGDVERAIDLYTKSIGVFPTAEAYTFRGWAYSFQNRFDDAIDECKRAIEIDPDFGNPYNDIGSYLIQLGKLDEAVTWLEKAKKATRYESRHVPFMNLGRLYSARGTLRLAIREFETALAIFPGEPSCMAALAELRRSLH